MHTSLRPYYLMGILIALLLAVTGAGGLLVEGLYEPFMSAGLAAVQNTQDLVSLIAAPVLLAAMYFTGRGSARALVLWAGLLVYALYYYAFYAFDHVYTVFYPLYLAVEGLCTYSLIGLLASVDLEAFAGRVDRRMPVRFISVVLAMALLFVPIWLGMLLPDIGAQKARETATVFVLDLSFLIPAMAFAAVQIWRRRPIGCLLGGVLIVKAPISGILLAVMSLRAVQLDATVATEELGMYFLLAIAGSLGLGLYMRNLQNRPGGVGRAY